MVRKRILEAHGIEAGHPVLDEEERLIRLSVDDVRAFLEKNRVRWRVPEPKARMVIVQYVILRAGEALRVQDVEPDVREYVMSSLGDGSIDAVFPSNWLAR